MNWPSTRLTEMLGIDYPLIQAPMAGGITTPELIAAVSNAGGLGSLGAGYMTPGAIRDAIQAIRELTDRPFAVNLFVPEPVREDATRIRQAHRLLAPLRSEMGLPEPEPLASFGPNYADQLAVLIEESVEIVSFTFGVPGEHEMDTLKRLGITTVGTATHMLEAILLEEAGLDLIVAQGMEAGGHRGTFLGSTEQGLQGALILLPLLVDQLRTPVIAAGGIMDGRGIAAALMLGAAGAQMGTAFLATSESGAHPKYKEALLDSTELTTVLTRVFSGRPARGLRNRFVETLSAAEAELPGYPVQNALTRDIRRAAAERDLPELMSLWAGMGCAMCRAEPAAELVGRWLAQAGELLSRA
ncbi:MAG: nitronate monooxygenase [Candidatus Competibacterales bacterium]|nr:nitronate monooxygenase [Candidatus Competibacterales bacterium]